MTFTDNRVEEVQQLIQSLHSEAVVFCNSVIPGKFANQTQTIQVAKFDVQSSPLVGIVAKSLSPLKIPQIISSLKENPFLILAQAPFQVKSLQKFHFNQDFVFLAKLEGKMGDFEQLLTFSVKTEGKQTIIVQKSIKLEEVPENNRSNATNVIYLQENEDKTEITLYSHQDIKRVPAIIYNLNAKKRRQVLERFE
ncbi:Conserved_hypothetical protein [Hexamita inflata]|uniref:Uncharacterized protein n=1 Tax=Hexamita inflata TaxID=28002 RepID=A0AA86QZ14_9EUKA|nr:Conserved hypothetical protein [Hexamita inflata]